MVAALCLVSGVQGVCVCVVPLSTGFGAEALGPTELTGRSETPTELTL